MSSNNIEHWEIISSETEYRTRIFDIKRQNAKSKQGKAGDFYVIDTNDWVNVVAETEDGQIVLVRQYRHGIDDMSLEIPGGVIDDGEDSGLSAKRELEEETGFVSDEWEYLGKSSSNAAIMNNFTHTWWAKNCRRVSEQNLDEHEEIDIVLKSRDEFLEMVRKGEIHHSIVLAGICKWMLRR